MSAKRSNQFAPGNGGGPTSARNRTSKTRTVMSKSAQKLAREDREYGLSGNRPWKGGFPGGNK